MYTKPGNTEYNSQWGNKYKKYTNKCLSDKPRVYYLEYNKAIGIFEIFATDIQF